MSDKYFRPYIAVHILLLREERIFLMRRQNTPWMNGWYGLAEGHVEDNEIASLAAIREAQEEAGITIQPQDLDFIQVMHRKAPDRIYIDLFFAASKWQGEPKIGEPDRCDQADWFALDALPENTLPYIAAAISEYKQNHLYVNYGWDNQAETKA